jgi:hypothetical protein
MEYYARIEVFVMGKKGREIVGVDIKELLKDLMHAFPPLV